MFIKFKALLSFHEPGAAGPPPTAHVIVVNADHIVAYHRTEDIGKTLLVLTTRQFLVDDPFDTVDALVRGIQPLVPS
jgi:hypothetical protein